MLWDKEATVGSKCPYCQSEVLFSKSSEFIYKKDFGSVYYCSKFPSCNAFVGCHKITGRALGRLADGELREFKKQAHYHFDEIWKEEFEKGQKNARSLRYEWLSKELKIPIEETHIGMFDVETCKLVIELCKPYADTIRHKKTPRIDC